MKVAIIGTGRMGRGFATALAPKHQVTVGSRDPNRARQVASATGAVAARLRAGVRLHGLRPPGPR